MESLVGRSSGQEGLDSVLDLPSLLAELGPQGLACLAASSKSLQQTVEANACRYGLVMLGSVIDTARSSSKVMKNMQAVEWVAALLLRRAPATAADVATRLLNLPEVPSELATRLVAAGARISYAQLLAAARNMVAGVEVWVQAQQQLGIQTDIPAEAVTVCCNDGGLDTFWAFKNGGADLLQLAINCRSNIIVFRAIQRLQATAAEASLLEPAVARKLLLAAATQLKIGAVEQMVELPIMQQHVDSARLEALVTQLLETHGHEPVECVLQLCKLPAAALMSRAAVMSVLQAAIREVGHVCRRPDIAAVCRLSVAQQLSSEAVEELVRVAMSSRRFACVEVVCGLPAAQQLSSAALARLLRLAVSCDGYTGSCTQELCQLPAAEQISSQAVAALLQAALGSGNTVCAKILSQLPAAQQLSSQAVAALLQAALGSGSTVCAKILCQVPTAQQRSSEALLQLLQAALEQGTVPAELCRLPAAAIISSATVLQLPQAALERGSGLEGLCELPAAARISSLAVLELLLAALKQGRVPAELCKLPAAACFSSKAVMVLLHAAAGKDWKCVEMICALPAAAQLRAGGNDDVFVLLSTAVKRGCHRTVGELSAGLPPSLLRQLNGQHMEQLLAAALEQGSDGHCARCVQELWQLPATAGVSSEVVLQLLQAAVEKGFCSSISALCAVPATVELSGEAVVALLSAAVERRCPMTLDAISKCLLLEKLSLQQLDQISAQLKQLGLDTQGQ